MIRAKVPLVGFSTKADFSSPGHLVQNLASPMLPLDILEGAKSRRVSLHTVDQDVYSGVLVDFDIYANTVLAETTYTNPGTKQNESLGECIVQGGNVTYIEIHGHLA